MELLIIINNTLDIIGFDTIIGIYSIIAFIIFAIFIFVAELITRKTGDLEIYTDGFQSFESVSKSHLIKYLNIDCAVKLLLIAIIASIILFLIGVPNCVLILILFILLLLTFCCILKLVKFIKNWPISLVSLKREFMRNMKEKIGDFFKNTTIEKTSTEHDWNPDYKDVYNKEIRFLSDSAYIKNIKHDDIKKEIDLIRKEVKKFSDSIFLSNTEQNSKSKEKNKIIFNCFFLDVSSKLNKINKLDVLYSFNFCSTQEMEEKFKIEVEQKLKNITKKFEKRFLKFIEFTNKEETISISFFMDKVSKISGELLNIIRSGTLYKIENILRDREFRENNIYDFLSFSNIRYEPNFSYKIPEIIIRGRNVDDFNTISRFYFNLLIISIGDRNPFITEWFLRGFFRFFILSKDIEDGEFKKFVEKEVLKYLGYTETRPGGIDYDFNQIFSEKRFLNEKEKEIVPTVFNSFKEAILELFFKEQMEDCIVFLKLLNDKFLPEDSDYKKIKIDNETARIKFEVIMGLSAFLSYNINDENKQGKIISIFEKQLLAFYRKNNPESNSISAAWIIKQIIGVLKDDGKIVRNGGPYNKKYNWSMFFSNYRTGFWTSHNKEKEMIEHLLPKLLIHILLKKYLKLEQEGYINYKIEFKYDIFESEEIIEELKYLKKIIFDENIFGLKDMVESDEDVKRFFEYIKKKCEDGE